MELAIPLLALGSMYIISNQKNNSNNSNNSGGGYGSGGGVKRETAHEGYENMGERKGQLPNTNLLPNNYPVQQATSVGKDINGYANPNFAMDRYYNDQLSSKLVAGGNQFGDPYTGGSFESLSGSRVNGSDFNHNNMVPFFGGKIRGFTADSNVYETLFDNKTGTGSQHISKKERAPLFAPQDRMHNVHGMQNNNDFIQSRMMPSTKIANVKPWEEERVAPGLDKGFNGSAGAGFNSGLEAREKWVDRGVDELRVLTNPKQTFSLDGHQGPANSFIKEYANTGHLGKFEKNLPDTYFVNTPDRWFTTTGQEKAPTLRAVEVEKDVNRVTTTSEYYGVNSNVGGNNTYAPNNYEDTKRQEYDAKPVINAHSAQKNTATKGDFGHDSYTYANNNRTTVRGPEMGGVYGIVRAIMAPVLDVLRPSRKENVTGNPRMYGNAESHVPAGSSSTFNPADRLPTTIRETTLGLVGMDHMSINRQGTVAGAYGNTPQLDFETARESTSTEYTGNSGGASTRAGVPLYNAAYNQQLNVNKTYPNRPNQGNMSLLGTETNISVAKLEADRNNNRMWIPTNAPPQIPSMEQFGQMSMPQTYDNNLNTERMDPSILNAFRQNPYTKSLNVY